MVQLYIRDGGEFVVNSVTAENQLGPSLVRLASGGFVIVWTSQTGPASTDWEVRGQLYSADGTPAGGEFLASPSTGFRAEARVASLSTGGFVVTWTYDVHDGTGIGNAPEAYRIRGQIYDSAGAKVGGEIPIGPNTTGYHLDSQPIGLAGGGFAVAWSLDTRPGTVIDRDAVVQLFDSSGAATSGLVSLASLTAGNQFFPALAALPGGGFVAAWTDSNSGAAGDNSTSGVKAQLFDSAGARLGGEFLVNTTVPLQQVSPSVATLASGGFVVSWTDSSATGGDSSGQAVRAQVFDAAGAKVGGELLVNTKSEGDQILSAVTALADGGFVVAWRDGTQADGDIEAQAFDAAGAKAGIEFLVNSETAGLQTSPAVLGLADGSFVAAWTDGGGSDGSLQGVKAQLFAPTAAAPSDISISNLELDETAIENVTVATLSTEGAANSGFSYEIVADSSGGAFRIEGDRLVVADNARLDYETATDVTVTIRTTDVNGRTYDEDFTLEVRDVGYERRYSQEPEFQANLTEAGEQAESKAIPLAGGGFALIWEQYNDSDPNPLKTMVRFFGADGAAQSTEHVIVDSWTGGLAVTPLVNGGLLIVREAYNEPEGTFSIKGQAYDSEGNAVGPEITVGSSQSVPFAHSPTAVELSSGEYLISWATPRNEIHAQRVTPEGAASGEEIVIASAVESAPISLVATPPSGFVAAWIEAPAEPEGAFLVRTRVYDVNNELVGETSTPVWATDISGATVIALPDGGYMVGWVEVADELEGVLLQVVMAQHVGFAEDGWQPLGEPMELTAFIAEADFGEVSFAAHPDQGFVVLWPMIGASDDGVPTHVFLGSLFNECGCPVGSVFQPNPAGHGAVATVLADGTIAVSWTGFDSDQSGVFARVYRPAVEPFDPSGDDHLIGDEQVNRLDGQGGDDRIYGLDGDDDLIGGTGNDIMDGGPGADSMTGGPGNDVYVVDDEGDEVVEDAGGGIDEIRTDLAAFSLAGLPNVENLVSTSPSDQALTGNGRDNAIHSGVGDDFIDLQAGGNDSALGAEGDDVFLFGASMTLDDQADGGNGIDQIVLQGDYWGAKALTFGFAITGIENLAILPGSDMRFGDPGTGSYDYDITLLDSHVRQGAQMVIDANRLRTGEDFTFDGSAEYDGSFFIYAGGGVDDLTGGAKNDVFLFGAQGQWGADDVVKGGGGTDQLALRGDYVIVFGGAQLVAIEQIAMVSAFDTRFGALGATYDYDLTMDDGNVDSIQMTVDAAPLRSSETLTFDGSAEDDGSFRVFGGAGADVIAGSRNGDILVGQDGADTLTGNGGADLFRYNAASDSATGAVDRILDFTPGSDKIDLSRIDADTNAGGDQAFRWIGSDAFGPSGTSAGELRAYQSGGRWFVEGDTDGDGAADLVIDLTLVGPTPLSAGDFLL